MAKFKGLSKVQPETSGPPVAEAGRLDALIQPLAGGEGVGRPEGRKITGVLANLAPQAVPNAG